ncbi:MAG: polysaccharide deacetylase family protein [Firmicutes bacterium]|nr:polysaccharide deacetylase family protein [Bacillota bacterium]
MRPGFVGRWRRLFLAHFLIGSFFLTLSYFFLLSAQIQVTINGRAIRVFPWIGVGRAVTAAGVFAPPGDLLDVTGKVLQAGGGRPPAYRKNSRETTPQDRLSPGDAIVVEAGEDVVESVTEETRRQPSPLQVEGVGAFLRVVRKGEPGEEVVARGSLSGKTKEIRIKQVATPTVLRRFDYNLARKIAVLTFDDGPISPYTNEILAILDRYQIKGVFFVVGREVEAHPDLVRRIVAGNHELGNHTFSHRLSDSDEREKIAGELSRTEEAVQRASPGARLRWFRPPGGVLGGWILDVAEERGYVPILWSVDSKDWGKPADGIAEKVLDEVRGGSVLLFHDGGGNREATVNALPGIIEGLKSRGYNFMTLSELFYYLGLD